MTLIPAPGESDEQLRARFVREAEPHFDVLFRRACRLTRNRTDGEDLLQDSLLHAYAGFRHFEEGGNLKAWMLRILYNRWVSNHRHRQSRPEELPFDLRADPVPPRSVTHQYVSQRSAEAEALDILPDDVIRAAMNTLPDDFRIAVFYADVQGYSYAQIAQEVDIPLGTVMSRLFRGRRRLRTALADYASGHTDRDQGRRRIA